MICDNISVNGEGHLTFAGYDTVSLAQEFHTPLYLIDESKIREKCRIFCGAMKKAFSEDAVPLYAGKALCFKRMYEIMREEGMGADVVSSGELYTALRGGMPPELLFFHGNNKTDDDIRYGISKKVGYFVCDNTDELLALQTEAERQGTVQKVLLRITPGVDPHTHKAINTGRVDSKFGAAIETGQADELTRLALSLPSLALCGFHCHIGSQIFDEKPFCLAAELMTAFIVHIRNAYGYAPKELNLGGGMGVRYLDSHPQIDYAENILKIGELLHRRFAENGIPFPRILMEPGRSIVADAGMTLYTVGGRKEIPGFRNYVSVDGGMADNPRYALYQAPYTVYTANRMREKADYVCTVAGRCCESGDLIQENVPIAKPSRGDILAVLTTGAYNYAMASNYNRLPRPPIVMLNKSGAHIAVKRETLDDLIRNDC